MYLGMNEKLVSIHRHLRVQSEKQLSDAVMQELREAVMGANSSELVPGNKIEGNEIKLVVVKHRDGIEETVVTLEVTNEEAELV